MAKNTKSWLDKHQGKDFNKKPNFISKCIHTFRCLFNRDCEKIAKSELTKMTKAQLETLGREKGIELDKRKTKAKLVEQLYDAL